MSLILLEAPNGDLMSALVALLCAAHAYDPIIVDDEDGSPTFTTTGDDWTTWSTNGEGYDSSDTDYHYLSHTVGGSDRRGTATWTPELPVAGTWLIETWFRRTENRTDDADHVVYDGYGAATSMSIDQQGSGGSGWLSLGEYYCEAGSGGCYVVLDGTDDDESDEANAMRFTLIAEGEVEPEPEEDCSEDPGPGTHQITFYAADVTASSSGDDWESVSYAEGDPDGLEAHSPNVDSGEYLRAASWDICDPVGDEVIDRVEIGVLGRLQYDSGTYALTMAFDAGGAATTWSHTSSAWTTLDITGDRGSWAWSDLASLPAQVTLHDHPGGQRDSDAWVDAFSITVTYTTADSGDDGGGDDGGDGGVDSDPGAGGVDSDPGEGGADTDRGDGDDGGGGGRPRADSAEPDTAYDDDRRYMSAKSGCSVTGVGGAGWALLPALALWVRRRKLQRH